MVTAISRLVGVMHVFEVGLSEDEDTSGSMEATPAGRVGEWLMSDWRIAKVTVPW